MITVLAPQECLRGASVQPTSSNRPLTHPYRSHPGSSNLNGLPPAQDIVNTRHTVERVLSGPSRRAPGTGSIRFFRTIQDLKNVLMRAMST